MEADPISTKLKWLVRWLSKWFLIPSVVVISLLSPDFRSHLVWICVWLRSVRRLISLCWGKILSRTEKSYETRGFRLVRIHLMAIFGSILIALTGGAASPFWFIYLWSLFAGAPCPSWSATWRVYGEVAALYCLASLVAAGGASQELM